MSAQAPSSITHNTLSDWGSRLDPDGSFADVVNTLVEKNEILDDIHWEESNLVDGHQTTRMTKMPEASLVSINKGIMPSKGEATPVKAAACSIGALSETHTELADKASKKPEFLAAQDREKILTLNQKFVHLLFNGSHAKSDLEMDGFYSYYDKSAEAVAKRVKYTELAGQLLDAEGTGDNCTSIFIINWNPAKAFCFFPKGSKAGIRIDDLGKVSVRMPDGSAMTVYQTFYYQDFGLCIRDERECVRIMNIDVTKLQKDPEKGGADICDLLIQGIEKLQDATVGRPVIYCPQIIRSALRRQITRHSNVHLSMEQVAGRRVVAFDGYPVRRVDAISTKEVSTNTP